MFYRGFLTKIFRGELQQCEVLLLNPLAFLCGFLGLWPMNEQVPEVWLASEENRAPLSKPPCFPFKGSQSEERGVSNGLCAQG